MIMALELLDESRIKKTGVRPDIKIEIDIDKKYEKGKNEKEIKIETKIVKQSSVKKIGFELLKKENIAGCERRENGMTDNCALCKALNNETFNRCTNKWL